MPYACGARSRNCRLIAAHVLPGAIVHADDAAWAHAEVLLLALLRSRDGARVLLPLFRLQTFSVGHADGAADARRPAGCSRADAVARAARLVYAVDSG